MAATMTSRTTLLCSPHTWLLWAGDIRRTLLSSAQKICIGKGMQKHLPSKWPNGLPDNGSRKCNNSSSLWAAASRCLDPLTFYLVRDIWEFWNTTRQKEDGQLWQLLSSLLFSNPQNIYSVMGKGSSTCSDLNGQTEAWALSTVWSIGQCLIRPKMWH